MREIIINEKFKWIDICPPKGLDIQLLRKSFNVHPVILDELMHPSTRCKVENYDGYIFIVAQLPNYEPEIRSAREAEIDILVTRDVFITVHHEDLEPLEQFEKLFLNEKLKNSITDTGQLVYYLLGEIDNFSLRQLRHIEEKLKKIGKNLFKGEERRLLEEISYLKRDLANFGSIIWPQRNILESLVGSGTNFWGEKMRVYFSDALGHHLQVTYLFNNLKETMVSFEETNSQLLNFKTNETMKIFTVLAFLTFPLILFFSVLQINLINDFFSRRPADIWILFGLVLATLAVLFVFFRKKNWL